MDVLYKKEHPVKKKTGQVNIRYLGIPTSWKSDVNVKFLSLNLQNYWQIGEGKSYKNKEKEWKTPLKLI
jgi:hypothetical protein